MSREDVLAGEKTCVRLCFEYWELASNKIRDMVEGNAAPLPGSVLRNLGDKMYEKRKAAALEVINCFPFPSIFICFSHDSSNTLLDC